MAPSSSFNDIVKELKERKKFEAGIAKKTQNEKCKQCGGNIAAIGRSTIQGMCSICVSLAILPDP